MRTLDEVHYAHDLLHPIVTGEIANFKNKLERIRFEAALLALCWVLDHPSGMAFAKTLVNVKRELKSLGYELVPDARRDGHK